MGRINGRNGRPQARQQHRIRPSARTRMTIWKYSRWMRMTEMMIRAWRAHSALRRCLDGAERACRALAAEGAAQDAANTSSAQTSAGTSTGTSADGRFSHPLMHGDIAGWLGRAFPRVGARP